MPLSDKTFDKKIEEFLTQNKFDNYLDIGCGAGKYGKMLKKIDPQKKVIGIEVESDYIDKYGTTNIYDEVKNIKVEDFIRDNLSFQTDVAIMGDLLEHLFKSDGIDLVNYLMYRTKYMIIVFPSKFVMYEFKGYKSEAHNSVWNKADFKNFDHQFTKIGIMNLVIIKGYLSDSETVYNLD